MGIRRLALLAGVVALGLPTLALGQGQSVPPSAFQKARDALNSPTGVKVVNGAVGGVGTVSGAYDTYNNCKTGAVVACASDVTGRAAGAVQAGATVNAGLLKNAQEIHDGAGLVYPVASEGTLDLSKAIQNSERLATGAKVVGKVAAGVSVGVTGYETYKACSSGDVGNCVLGGAGTVASVAELIPGPVQAVGASFNAGVAVGTLLDSGYTAVRGKSLGEDIYNVSHRDEDAEIWAKAEARQGEMTARADANYQAGATTLRDQQQRYDDQQAEIQQQQIAAQQQQQQNLQAQDFMNNLQAMTRPQGQFSPLAGPVATPAAPVPAAAANPTGCHTGHDEQAHPGGCHQAAISGANR